KNTNDLGKGIKRIADENRVYYLLGYHPSNTARDGKFRKIKVNINNRKGVEVRARKGYYAPVDAALAKGDKKPSDKPVDPVFQQALNSPYDMNHVPPRMSAYVFEETLLGKARVLIITDLNIHNFAFDEKESRFLDTLQFLPTAMHRETGEYFRYDQH